MVETASLISYFPGCSALKCNCPYIDIVVCKALLALAFWGYTCDINLSNLF